MLELPDVTFWSIVWSDDRKWIIRVGQMLRYCLTIARPARTILFTHEKLAPINYPWETIQIPKLNWQSYNIFINRVVPNYIESEFSMSLHEDGFILDPTQWTPDFLKYDYIGAPWDDRVVGNGGFNIESRKLMDLKCSMPVTEEDFSVPSDRLICTTRRKFLEDHGVVFAPFDLALKFSTEQVGNERPSFGFHGRGASPQKYKKGWNMINTTPRRTYQKDNGFTLERNRVVPVNRFAVRQPHDPVAPKLSPVPIPPSADMKITVVYVYPLSAGDKYKKYAARFLDSYRDNGPGRDHETLVMLNGGRPTPALEKQFGDVLPNCRLMYHDNSGYDIGAFQAASRQCRNDIIVFFGASTYFYRTGWLERMAQAVDDHGYALYGAMGNKGDPNVRVWPHIRTTAFWTPPSLFNAYPRIIKRYNERHGFEHGPESFTGWITKRGIKAWVVTWTGEYEWEHWDSDPNGFHRGDESNLLAGDHISEPPYYNHGVKMVPCLA